MLYILRYSLSVNFFSSKLCAEFIQFVNEAKRKSSFHRNIHFIVLSGAAPTEMDRESGQCVRNM